MSNRLCIIIFVQQATPISHASTGLSAFPSHVAYCRLPSYPTCTHEPCLLPYPSSFPFFPASTTFLSLHFSASCPFSHSLPPKPIPSLLNLESVEHFRERKKEHLGSLKGAKKPRKRGPLFTEWKPCKKNPPLPFFSRARRLETSTAYCQLEKPAQLRGEISACLSFPHAFAWSLLLLSFFFFFHGE